MGTQQPISLARDNRRELAELFLLRERLEAEGEEELLAKIAICQEELVLKCQTCGGRKTVRQRCKRKWCPCCAKRLAADRATEMEFIVARFRWPLFVTLTMRNVSSISCGDIRKLRRAFGKLRHRKLWTSKVRGGVAAVEVTNIGNGWHPHMHAVIDCSWLAYKTKQAPPRSSREEKKAAFKAAKIELEGIWSKIIGQQTSSVDVKRANRETIAKEVTKYTVKNEDLVTSEGSAGELIRALDGTRLMTTFGSAHGQTVKEVRLLAKEAAKVKRKEFREANSETDCCPDPDFMPDSVFIAEPNRRLRRLGRLVCTSTLSARDLLNPQVHIG